MKINWLNVTTGGGAVLLVGSEILAVAGATVWAGAGLAGIPPGLSLVLLAVGTVAALALTGVFAVQVHRVEPFFGNGEHAVADGTADSANDGMTSGFGSSAGAA